MKIIVGLYWGASLTETAELSDNGIWKQVSNMTISIPLNHDVKGLVIYHLDVQAVGPVLENPLPRDSVKDTIQSRIIIDNSPYRASACSGSVFSSADSKTFITLSGSFVVPLKAGIHQISIQWKKTGSVTRQWVAGSNSLPAASSIVVHTDHTKVFSQNSLRDAVITQQNLWVPVSTADTPLKFSLTRETPITIGYSMSIMPQLITVVKDHRMEFLSTRININGMGYMEGADSYGTTSWNPSAVTLEGLYSFVLPAGHHTVFLQWKKVGTIFRSWTSSPSLMDGFAGSRNLFILQDNYATAPHLVPYDYNRAVLRSQGVGEENSWTTLPTSTLSFDLAKPSAVLISYGLPVTQHGNPVIDSYLWEKLSGIETRVVVDGLAYKFSGQGLLQSSTRTNGQVRGELPLVLTEGTHSVALQWKSNLINWTTIMGTEYGFTMKEQMLVMVSSNNSVPVIELGGVGLPDGVKSVVSSEQQPVHVDEDTELDLVGISVADVDDRLYPGMEVDFTLSVNIGTLELPVIPEVADGYHKYLDTSPHPEIAIHDSIALVNAIIANLRYNPPLNFNGGDVVVTLTLSDLGSIGNGDALSTTSTISIMVDPVDDPFVLNFFDTWYVEEGRTKAIPALDLFDLDSQTAVFAVEISTVCGNLAVGNRVANDDQALLAALEFAIPGAVSGSAGNITLPVTSALKFQGPYATIQKSLRSLLFTASPYCNRNQHGAIMSLKVSNTENDEHTLTRVLDVVIVPVNTAPEIIVNQYPRWTIDGVELVPSLDSLSNNYTYSQLPFGEKQALGVTASTPSGDMRTRLWSQGSASSGGEVAIISGDHDSYMVQIQFNNYTIDLQSSMYVPLGMDATVILHSNIPFNPDDAGLYCNIDNSPIAFPAVQNSTGHILCTVHFDAEMTAAMDQSGSWIQVASSTDSRVRSNFVQLYAQVQPVIVDFTPTTVFESDMVLLHVFALHATPVDRCFNEYMVFDALTTALSDHFSVVCAVRLSEVLARNGSVSFVIGSRNGDFRSNEITLEVVADPVVSSVEVQRVNGVGLASFAGTWNLDAVSATSVKCAAGSTMTEPVEISGSRILCPYTCASEGRLVTAYLDYTEAPSLDANVSAVVSVDGLQTTEDGYIAHLAPMQKLVLSSFMNLSESVNMKDVAVDLTCRDVMCRNVLLLHNSHSIEVHTVVAEDFTVTVNYRTVSVNIDVRVVLSSCNGGAPDMSSPLSLQFGAVHTASSTVSLLANTEPVDVDLIESISLTPVEGSTVLTNTWIELAAATGTLDSFSALLCQYNDEFTTPALLVSTTSVTCVVPDTDGVVEGAVTVRLIDQYVGASSNRVDLTVVRTPVVSNIIPLEGMGGSEITVSGLGLAAWESSVACKFDALLVMGTGFETVNGTTTFKCVVPYYQHGHSVLQILADDIKVASATFLFVAAPFAVFDDSGNALTQEDIAATVITSNIAPVGGAVRGGNSVSFSGLGLLAIKNSLVCHIGNGSSPVQVISDVYAQCMVPAATDNTAGKLPFRVSTNNGLDITTTVSNLSYEYIRVPTVKSVFPSSGYSFGGTVLKISGSFLRAESGTSLAGVQCSVDGVSVPATWASESAIKCPCPAHSVASVSVSVKVDGVFSDSAVTYTYSASPVIAQASPSVGKTIGGDVVTITGTDFTAEITRCCFGLPSASQCSVAVLTSATELMCVSPRSAFHGASEIVDILLMGMDSGDHPVAVLSSGFTYVENTVITSTSTLRGGVTGGTTVRLYGGLFNSEIVGDSVCKFGESMIPLRAVNETTLECISPASSEGAATTVPFTVVSNHGIFLSQPVNLVFKYEVEPVLISVAPSTVAASGNVDVEIESLNVAPFDDIWCIFDDVTSVRGGLSGGNKVVCTVPPHVVGTASLSVQAGAGLISNSLPITYVPSNIDSIRTLLAADSGASADSGDSVVMTNASPRYSSVDGGTSVFVDVMGIESMSHFSSFSCQFVSEGGSVVEVPAKMLSSTVLVCITPVASGVETVSFKFTSRSAIDDSVRVVTSLLGDVPFHFVMTPVIVALLPESGFAAGNTLLTVVGEGFTNSGNLRCKFGVDVDVPATFVSVSEVHCIAPPHGAGAVDFTVTVNGISPVDRTVYTFIPSPAVYAVSPAVVSTSGGAVITIVGSAEVSSVKSCIFDTVVVLVTEYDSVLSSIKCRSPARSSPGNVHLSLSSTEDMVGALKSTSVVKYTDEVASVTSYFPRYGSTLNKVAITFNGHGLSLVKHCVFDTDVSVEAYPVNDTAIMCVAPALSLTSGVIKFDTIESITLPFGFITPPVVSSLVPVEGAIGEVAFITIEGNSFSQDLVYACEFDHSEVSVGYVLSETQLNCKLPKSQQFTGRTVKVNLLVSGVPAVGTALFFSFTASEIVSSAAVSEKVSALLTSVSPLVGDVAGGTVVSLRGVGFVSYSSTYCHFGVKKVLATVFSESSLSCVSPAASSPGQVVLTVDNAIGNREFVFEYVTLPVVSSMSPATGYATGGVIVNAYSASGGFGAANMPVVCKFGVAKSLGVVISDTEVACSLPQLSVGVYPVEVVMHSAVLLAETDLSITVIPVPTVASISPLIGTGAGGAVIRVTGFNFHGSCECLFDSVAGECSIASDDVLQCTSPAADVVEAVELDFVFNGVCGLIPGYVFQYIHAPTVLDVQPLVGDLRGSALVTIYGYDFSLRTPTYCMFGTEHKVQAAVLTPNSMTCQAPVVSGVSTTNLTVTGISGELFQAPFSFQDIPVILGVIFFAAELTAVITIAPDTDLTQSNWVCAYKGLHFSAEVLSADTLVCDVSSSLALQRLDGDLYIEDLTNHIRSSEFDLVTSKIVGSFNNVASPSYASTSGSFGGDSFMNLTDIYNPGYIAQRLAWYQGAQAVASIVREDEDLSSASLASSTVSKAVAFSDSSSNFADQQRLSMHRVLNNCAFNDDARCVSTLSNLDGVGVVSGDTEIANVFGSSSEDHFPGVPAHSSVVTMDAVEPRFINPFTGTSVNVVGNGFSSGVICLLDNAVLLETSVFSANLLQCHIPLLDASLKDVSVQTQLSLVVLSDDATAVSSPIEAIVVQSNSIPMFYDLLNIKKIASGYSAGDSSTVAVDSTESQSVSCMSADGCVDVVSSDAIVQNRTALMSDFSIAEKLGNWKFANPSGIGQSNSEYAEHSVEFSVYFMEPSVISVGHDNATVVPVHFYGSEFSAAAAPFCINSDLATAEATACRVLSNTLMQCPMELVGDAPPGVHRVKLLSNCSSDSVVFDAPIGVLLDTATVTSSAELEVSLEYPTITAAKPLAGSVNGGTPLVLSGENLQNITFCGLRSLESSLIFVAAADAAGAELKCTVPKISHAGDYRVVVSNLNSSWVDTGFAFRAFAAPVLYSFSRYTLPSQVQQDIYVSGDSFPVEMIAYCKIQYTDRKTTLRIAQTVSASLLICANVSVGASFFPASSLTISFNNIDYISLDVSPTELIRQLNDGEKSTVLAQNSFDYAVVDDYESSLSENAESHPISSKFGLGSRVQQRKVVCDGSMSLYFTAADLVPSVEYVCTLGGMSTGIARYINSTMLACEIPARVPGSYELRVLQEDDSVLAGSQKVEAEVQCIITPSVSSVTFKGQSTVDGVTTVVVSGVNMVSGIYCVIGSAVVTAMKDSDSTVLCNFDTLMPGYHQTIVRFGETVLYSSGSCFTTEALVNGWVAPASSMDEPDTMINGKSACMALLAEATRASGASGVDIEYTVSGGVMRDIINFYPRTGPAAGSTSIQFLLPELDASYFNLTCAFGEHLTPGFYVNPGRMFCVAPALDPGSYTLSVVAVGSRNSYYPGIKWGYGTFSVYPPLTIVSVSRSPVLHPFVQYNISSIDLVVSGLVSTSTEVVCRIGTEITPAYVNSLQSITCSLTDFVAKSLPVSLGSSFEAWSNTVSLDAEAVVEGAKIVPTFGNVNGGTTLTISLNRALVAFEPACFFGNGDLMLLETAVTDHEADGMLVRGMVGADGESVLCVSPLGGNTEGPVVVTVVDSNDHSAVYAHTRFTFERPAELVSVTPSQIVRGTDSSSSLFIQGVNFRDSSQLVCSINAGSLVVTARWLSSNMLRCDLSAATVDSMAAEEVSIRVSNNNGGDLSANTATVPVKNNVFLTSVSPVDGWLSGGTLITLVFPQPHGGPISCRFGTRIVRAFTIDDYSVAVVSPAVTQAGMFTVAVLLDSAEVSSFEFWFHQVPVVTDIKPAVLLSGYTGEVKVSGSGLIIRDEVATVRFSRDSGELVESSCAVASVEEESVRCALSNVPADRFIYMDISANGQDFLLQVAVVQVFDPAIVVGMTSRRLFANGGESVDVMVTNVQSAYPLSCVFAPRDDASAGIRVRALPRSHSIVTCISPSLTPVADLVVSIEQNSQVLFTSAGWSVDPTPIAEHVTPVSVFAGRVSSLEVSFADPLVVFDVRMDCIVNSKHYPFRMLDDFLGVCVVKPNVAGVFPLTISIGSGAAEVTVRSGNITVVDPVNDMVVNASAVLNFGMSHIAIESPSCSIPPTVTCGIFDSDSALDGSAGVNAVRAAEEYLSAVPFDYNSCRLVCEVEVGVSAAVPKQLLFQVCPSASCDIALVSRTIAVLEMATIISLDPRQGSELGGNKVFVVGTGFSSDGDVECWFGEDKAASVVVLSNTHAVCESPATSTGPGLVTVSMRSDGIVVSESFVQYEYMTALSRVTLNTDRVSSLGGTVLVASTVSQLANDTVYSCRLGSEFVYAFRFNSSALRCVSLPTNYSTVAFAISANGADISGLQTLKVEIPPSVLLVEPTVVSSSRSTKTHVFTVMFGEDVDGDRVGCAMDTDDLRGQMVLVSDSVYNCELDGSLTSGEHELSLLYGDVMFRTIPIFAKSQATIHSVFPTTGFVSISTPVTVRSVSKLDTSSSISCCFNDFVSSAAVISETVLECHSPSFLSVDNGTEFRSSVTYRLGLAGPDGYCEYIGHDFVVMDVPRVESVSTEVGSTTGGTSVLVTFTASIVPAAERSIQRVVYHARIGQNVMEASVVDDHTLLFITKPHYTGEFAIELSVDNMNFVDMARVFEYVPVLAGDVEAPELEHSIPVVQLLSPSTFPAGGKTSVVRISGSGFERGCKCVLGQGVSSTRARARFLSATLVECTLPVHIPGEDYIAVQNPGDYISLVKSIFFVEAASVFSGAPDSTVMPSFGPREGNTMITVMGVNLDAVATDLYCVIGEDYSYAVSRTDSSVQCITPSSPFSGKVMVRLASSDKEYLSGGLYFEYIDDPLIFDTKPDYGSVDTEVLMTGRGFVRMPFLTCLFGDVPALRTTVIDDERLLCSVPPLDTGKYSVTLNTNGQHYLRSGMIFDYFSQTELYSLWPTNGPALRGGTVVTIRGTGFRDNVDTKCVFGYSTVPAVIIDSETVQCRTISQRPGIVNVSVVADGSLTHPADQNLQFGFMPDVSVDKIKPQFGYTSGEFAVLVFGTNFINTTSLGCRFADMASRGVYLSNQSLMCLAPSPLGRSLLRSTLVKLEVTVNGYDFSESGIVFNYSQPCDQGFFCSGVSRQLCPNGTFCPTNSLNFSLCPPGTFQPREGQIDCVICPVGYICPDFGLMRPIICPAGFICDVMGLRAARMSCPSGFYCLNGTKAFSVQEYLGTTKGSIGDALEPWSEEYVTGSVLLDMDTYDWSYRDWPLPAVGTSRRMWPPAQQCDGNDCDPGSVAVLAEAPFPCPIGHYCRSGATSQIPIPKNFSTPQRCYDGFFCPRGSFSPEGSGPCPTGYFCPTQLDALVCPQGHYCPGVGNSYPLECYPGTYNPFDGGSNCTVCPTGHICPSWGTLLPEKCPAGFVCMALGLSYPVVLCPQGYFCNPGTLTLDPADPTEFRPIACRPGVFCLGGVAYETIVEWIPSQPFGATNAQTCSEGTYCDTGAFVASGSGLCFPGHYCPPATSFPISVPRGRFAGGYGSVAPALCFPGTYAPLESQIDCLPCPSGHSCQSYGSFIPGICPVGTYRSQVDSVTCRFCATGTYSFEVGASDLSQCLPCPPGRVCGTNTMYNLTSSTSCPAGYLCGYGTDRSRQFAHKCPAGFHTTEESRPEDQFNQVCLPGFYCERGTPTYLSLRAKCTVGFYCPQSTPSFSGVEVKCPRVTSSLSGTATLQGCRISEIDVCDKAPIDMKRPMEDLTYYQQFSYTTMDGSDVNLVYDSGAELNPTGEIVSVRKIIPVNRTSSVPGYVNDTIEAYRTCPQYGHESGGQVVTVIGQNFVDTKLNYCKWRACYSANYGRHPKRCLNQVDAVNVADTTLIGDVSAATYLSRAKYLSPTRMECEVPPYVFDLDFYSKYNASRITEGFETEFECLNITGEGQVVYHDPDAVTDPAVFGLPLGNYSFVRRCQGLLADCIHLPFENFEYFSNLTFPCSADDILEGVCSGKPEVGFMFNPCYSGEAVVEVSNDGVHYSGGDDMLGTEIIATLPPDQVDGKPVRNFQNYIIPPSFAVFTYVYSTYMHFNPDILRMEEKFCKLSRYAEEGYRERADGWFQLQLNEAAHVQMDLTMLPNDITYGEHYRIALFVQPSRCKLELCNAQRIRLPAQESLPCQLPVDFSPWFQDLSVPKNVKNNFTVYALEDVIFKIEVHILHGLFVQYLGLFKNTTTVRIAKPSRANANTGLSDYPTRKLSKYISFEERVVPMEYYFVAVYYQSLTYSVSQALNMPPSYQDYERGRVLVMYNVSDQVDPEQTPLVLDSFLSINRGPTFWNMPAATTAETKEMIDAYFETFQGMSYTGESYQYSFETLVLPYLPYFSNCYTFDSYIPIWLLFEGKECELPPGKPQKWRRSNYAPLPNQDDIHFVGPFDIGGFPIADVCVRTVHCNYEESLPNPDNTPRWFEAPTDSTLFFVIRTPFDYYKFTGRNGSSLSKEDNGGSTAVLASLQESPDNFIPVTVDHSAGDEIVGCEQLCFPRSFDMVVWYYQVSNYEKKLVRVFLEGDGYDFDDTNTGYSITTNMFALNYIELVLNFAYTMPIYVILFIVGGLLQNFINLVCYLANRMSTHLQNPPELKLWGYLVLTVPPPAAGVMLSIIPIWVLTAVGNNFLNGGEFISSPTVVTFAPYGTLYLDDYPLTYQAWDYTATTNTYTNGDMAEARSARVGSVFLLVAFCCALASIKMFFPKDETKRERELAERRTKLATRDELWQPNTWKISNFFMTGFFAACYCTAVIEFSYGDIFGSFFWTGFFVLYAMSEFVVKAVEHQLQDALLIMPVKCCIAFTMNIITFGAPDFLSFILTNYIATCLQVFEKVYMPDYLGAVSTYIGMVFSMIFRVIKIFIPKYIYDGGDKDDKMSKEEEKKLKEKREKEGVTGGGDDDEDEEAESVEPIIEHFADLTSDTFGAFSMPFIVYLLMQYRNEIGLAPGYGILQSDMAIYLVYQIFLIPFQMVSNLFIYSQNELYHGWKVYEYLVYSRYRFLQRETRWKGMEEALDECIEESLRKMDQMCFSSQYFLMLSTFALGLIYLMMAFEVFLRANYNPFSDPGFVMLFVVIVFVYILMEYVILWFAIKLKVWKIKHENTAWHIQRDDDDDLDIPDWDDVKGASHDAYLMNQRITSETFRYKFLNYNRAWLIQQLPQLLTPRTLRRSRPYLINQLARIISSRRDDISDDSGEEKDKKFGPVALTTSSRNIIRWWLGKAKRRLRLKQIVDPLIRKARGAECEQCLSRRQLQVEYEIDVDTMSRMYDSTYPGDEEVDQVQWKSFWMNNQRYHTVCLSCATKRKELARNDKVRNEGGGAGGEGGMNFLDDAPAEAYPDWGPVYLSAASKAIALNWYRKAQRARVGKKGLRKKDKIVKDVSDDEGDDLPKKWTKDMDPVSSSTNAIAQFWLHTARTRLLKRGGKGAGLREADVDAKQAEKQARLEAAAESEDNFRSGKKSKNRKK